jgi:hypothetical protein
LAARHARANNSLSSVSVQYFELQLRPIGGLAVDRAKADDWLTDNNLAGPYFNAKVANLHR